MGRPGVKLKGANPLVAASRQEDQIETMSARLPSLIAALAGAVLAAGATSAAAQGGACPAPTPATACPQCALAVVGTYSGRGASPTLHVERIIRTRPGLPDAAGPLRVVLNPSGPAGSRSCVFVPAEGQRMLYLLDPAPGAPGLYRIVWGFQAEPLV